MAMKNHRAPTNISSRTHSRKNAKGGNRDQAADSNTQQLDNTTISEDDDDDIPLYIPSKAGSRHLPLTEQPSDTRAVIRATIRHAIASFLFIDAYLVISCADTYYRNTLIDMANEMDLSRLASAIMQDRVFVKRSSRLVRGFACNVICVESDSGSRSSRAL